VNTKKQSELVFINLFREHYPDFPKGKLKPTESPDFILIIGPRRKIGLEITSLHPTVPETELLSYDNIKACLDAKNEKLSLYQKKKLNEYWLIITVNDIQSWKRIHVHNKLMIWKFETGYNHVFLLDAIDGKVLELNQ
jgi:hypothetical protein